MARQKLGITNGGYAWLRTIERTTGRPNSRLPRARMLSLRQHSPLAISAHSISTTISDGAREHQVSLQLSPWNEAELALARTFLDQEHEPWPGGDVPDHYQRRFSAAGLSVAVPLEQLEISCTCRSSIRPCTHALATLYRLVSSVDERPLTALELRMPSRLRREQDPDWWPLSELDPARFFTGQHQGRGLP